VPLWLLFGGERSADLLANYLCREPPFDGLI
jgi:hypothetical protein